MTSTLRTLGFSLFLLVAAAASGCGGVTGDYCDLKCECEGCSDNQLDACNVEEDARADQSDIYGCAEFHDEYLQCVVDNPFCDAADFRDPDACRTARERRDNCEGGRGVRIDLRAP